MDAATKTAAQRFTCLVWFVVVFLFVCVPVRVYIFWLKSVVHHSHQRKYAIHTRSNQYTLAIHTWISTILPEQKATTKHLNIDLSSIVTALLPPLTVRCTITSINKFGYCGRGESKKTRLLSVFASTGNTRSIERIYTHHTQTHEAFTRTTKIVQKNYTYGKQAVRAKFGSCL